MIKIIWVYFLVLSLVVAASLVVVLLFFSNFVDIVVDSGVCVIVVPSDPSDSSGVCDVDSSKILGEFMQEVYKTTGDMQRLKLVSYYLILVTQLKYDIMGIRSNPGGFYKMKIIGYESFRNTIDTFHNKIVEKLELEDFLKIK